jgi:hypothetical protein
MVIKVILHSPTRKLKIPIPIFPSPLSQVPSGIVQDKVWVALGGRVSVGVFVRVGVSVLVGVKVGVIVAVAVGMLVAVDVAVGKAVGVSVGAGVDVRLHAARNIKQEPVTTQRCHRLLLFILAP